MSIFILYSICATYLTLSTSIAMIMTLFFALRQNVFV